MLADMFNNHFDMDVTVDVINALIYRYGLGEQCKSVRFCYSKEQNDFLLLNRQLPIKHVCQQFNKHFNTQYTYASIRSRLMHITRSIDGGKRRQLEVNGRRLSLQQFVWECVHGPLPDGHVVVFSNGDCGNYGIANLKAIPSQALRSAAGKIRGQLPQGVSREIKAAVIAVTALQHRVEQKVNTQYSGVNYDK